MTRVARAVCAREGDSRWWLDGGVCGSSYRWWCRLSVVLPFLLFSAANTLTLAGSGDRPPGDANGEHPPFVVCPAFFGSPYHRPRPPRRTLMPWQATGTGRGPDARRALLRYSDRRPRLPARTRVPARPSVTRPTDPQRRASNRSGRLPPPRTVCFSSAIHPVPGTCTVLCTARVCARGTQDGAVAHTTYGPSNGPTGRVSRAAPPRESHHPSALCVATKQETQKEGDDCTPAGNTKRRRQSGKKD